MGACQSSRKDAASSLSSGKPQGESDQKESGSSLLQSEKTCSCYQSSNSSSSTPDILCGVSNAVYRNEYIQNIYALTSRELGVGVTGSVRVVIDRETHEHYALKTINLLGVPTEARERLIKESMILARLHHQNIVKLYEIYESNSAIYLVMELLSGGELFDRLMAQPGGCQGILSP